MEQKKTTHQPTIAPRMPQNTTTRNVFAVKAEQGLQKALKSEIPRSLGRRDAGAQSPRSSHRLSSTGSSAWGGKKRPGKGSSPGSPSHRRGAAQPYPGGGAQRSIPLAVNSSRPLTSPALGSGPLEAPLPRDSHIGAQTYQLQPSPLAPFKQANPPRPVSAARAPSQKAAKEAETRAGKDASEPRRARRRCQASSCPSASLRASLPRFAPSGKQVQNQAKEAMRQSGQARKASSRLGALDAGSRTGAGGYGQRRKRWHHSGVRPHSFDTRPCSSPALLPWTRRPRGGGRRGRTAGWRRGV